MIRSMFHPARPQCPGAVPGLLALVLSTAACGGDDRGPVQIRDSRVASRSYLQLSGPTTSEQRFGTLGPAAPRGSSSSAESPTELAWDVPAGWVQVPARSEFRLADFQVGGDPDAEVYVTILPSAGGGVLENVNRWREQVGAEPLEASEVDALPRITLLGNEAVYMQVDGTFQGMGGAALADARLAGLILPGRSSTLFVKFTGPREVVGEHIEEFLDFATSLRFSHSADDGHDHDDHGDHADHDHADHDHAEHEQGRSTTEGSSASPPAIGSAGGGAPTVSAAGLRFTLPPGWSEQPAGNMRLLTVRAGEAGDVAVSRAGGSFTQNVARWYGQLGLAPPSAEALEALPSVSVDGGTARWIELEGDFSGMGAEDQSGARLLGVIRPLDGDHLFVKLVGPGSAVAAEREHFRAFVESLELGDLK
jgi:hypothetical protein